MYSVILTELGITVFEDEKFLKSFPFSNPTSDYLAVKNKEDNSADDVSNFLSKFHSGIVVSDEHLFAILRKNSIEAHMMDESEIEKIQVEKPEILIKSGFAENQTEAISKLRDFAINLSSSKVTKVSESPDLHIIQAINNLDEIDKMGNALSSRLREWYGLHFPELENVVDSIIGYSKIVVVGKREKLSKEVFEDAGFPDSKVEMLMLISEKSRGGSISDENLVIVQTLAKQILDLHDLRKKLEEHIENQMNIIAPNLTAILGAAVGARILGRAGSLKKASSMPASTIQVLGAEKALFRSLKTGSQPPKHGLLFQHTLVHAAPRWQRGKIARAIAAKAAIAARVDVYSGELNQTLLEKLNIRVTEIGKKYEKPVERKETHSENNWKRSERGSGFKGKKFRNKNKSNKMKNKRRNNFGRKK